MTFERKPPTSDQVLAQQARDHAPRPVQPQQQPRPRPAPAQQPPLAAAGNGGNAAVASPPAVQPKASLPAIPDTRSNAAKFLDEVAPSDVVGRLITFTKDGKFAIEDTGEEIDGTAEFIALCSETLVGWIKFYRDGCTPPDRIMGLLYDDGFAMPPRDLLGDLDPDEWPTGLNGKKEDVWEQQMLLVLQSAGTSELYTFRTLNPTGRRAVGNLLKHYDRMRKSHPSEYPVVRLGTGGYMHKEKTVGWVVTPVFVAVGRAPVGSTAKPDTSPSGDFQDEIPFN